jgi:hypothetical protein
MSPLHFGQAKISKSSWLIAMAVSLRLNLFSFKNSIIYCRNQRISSTKYNLNLALHMKSSDSCKIQVPRPLCDPIYRLVRRGDTLGRSGMLPVNRWADRLLAVELCPTG